MKYDKLKADTRFKDSTAELLEFHVFCDVFLCCHPQSRAISLSTKHYNPNFGQWLSAVRYVFTRTSGCLAHSRFGYGNKE